MGKTQVLPVSLSPPPVPSLPAFDIAKISPPTAPLRTSANTDLAPSLAATFVPYALAFDGDILSVTPETSLEPKGRDSWA